LKNHKSEIDQSKDPPELIPIMDDISQPSTPELHELYDALFSIPPQKIRSELALIHGESLFASTNFNSANTLLLSVISSSGHYISLTTVLDANNLSVAEIISPKAHLVFRLNGELHEAIGSYYMQFTYNTDEVPSSFAFDALQDLPNDQFGRPAEIPSRIDLDDFPEEPDLRKVVQRSDLDKSKSVNFPTKQNFRSLESDDLFNDQELLVSSQGIIIPHPQVLELRLQCYSIPDVPVADVFMSAVAGPLTPHSTLQLRHSSHLRHTLISSHLVKCLLQK